jgi:hypothetical protein
VAFYGSGQLYIEESYTANKLFKAGIRTNNVDSNARLCLASASFGYTQTFGKDEPPGAYEDMDHADCFFLIGANPFECHPPLFERIQRRRRLHPETFVICVDPRRTQTADRSDLHLAPVPGPRRNRLEPLRPAHRTYRPPFDRARRGAGATAGARPRQRQALSPRHHRLRSARLRARPQRGRDPSLE